MDTVQTASSAFPPRRLPYFGRLFEAAKKTTVIQLRWPLVILCAYLLLYSPAVWLSPAQTDALLIVYLLPNATLYFVADEYFDSPYFYGPLLLFDTAILAIVLAVSGGATPDFYVACCLTLVLSCICNDSRGLIVVTILAPLLYGSIVFSSAALHDPSIYLLTANGAVGGPPIPPGVQIADLSGAMHAAISILAALVGCAKTGTGQYLDIGLFDGALSWASTIIGGAHAAGKPIERGKMQLNGGMACYNVYETRDGKFITLGALEPHFWAAFCKAIERDDLNPRAQEFQAVVEVAAIFKTRTFDEWMILFKEVDACIEPVRDFAETVNDPHVRHRGLISEIDGIKQSAGGASVTWNQPPAGEHSVTVTVGDGGRPAIGEVLRLSEEIAELIAARATGPAIRAAAVRAGLRTMQGGCAGAGAGRTDHAGGDQSCYRS